MGDLYRFRVNLPGCILCLVDWTSRVTFFCQLFRRGRHPFERSVQSDGDGSSICVGSVFAYKLPGKPWLDLWEVCDFLRTTQIPRKKNHPPPENGRMSSLKRDHFKKELSFSNHQFLGIMFFFSGIRRVILRSSCMCGSECFSYAVRVSPSHPFHEADAELRLGTRSLEGLHGTRGVTPNKASWGIPSKNRLFPGWGWRGPLNFSWLDALGDVRWKDSFARKFCLVEDFEGFPATKKFACCFSNYTIFIHFGMLCEFSEKSSVGQVLIICAAGRSPCKTLPRWYFKRFFNMFLPWKLVELIQFEEHILKLEETTLPSTIMEVQNVKNEPPQRQVSFMTLLFDFHQYGRRGIYFARH